MPGEYDAVPLVGDQTATFTNIGVNLNEFGNTHNSGKTLYERLRANGKTGKQALIAACNKLLKQVFAVVKNIRCINQIIVQQNRKKDQNLFGFLHSSC